MLSEDQIHRYARHVLLPEIGGVGQARWLAATARVELAEHHGRELVAIAYLAAAGVGTIVLGGGGAPVTAEDLRDGILYGANDVGRRRGDAVADRVRSINPSVRVVEGEEVAARPLPGPPAGLREQGPEGERDLAAALIAGGIAATRWLVDAAAAGTSPRERLG